MSFFDAIQTVWSKYAIFSGRASRPEFWWWTLFTVLLSILMGFMDEALTEAATEAAWGYAPFAEILWVEPLGLITSMVLMLPSISVGVRRLHDIDRSGWWYLIILIPIIGALVLLYWWVLPSTKDINSYGVPPSAANPDTHV